MSNIFRFGGVFEVVVDEPALLKALENQKNYRNFLRRISNRLAREVRRFTPVDTGRLRDSILPLDPEKDVGVVVQSGQRLKPKFVAGITIGDRTLIGAGSVVTKNIPNNSIAYGNPARVKVKNYRED